MGKYGISKNKTGLTLLLFSCLFLPINLLSAAPPPGVQLISCDRSGAVIVVQIPDLQAHEVQIAGQEFTDLSIADWSKTCEPGKPILPQTAILLALPPGARPQLTVEALDLRTIKIANLLPAPTLQVDIRGENPRENFLPDPSAYSSPAAFPREWATLGEPYWQRSYWVVPVRITPLKATPSRGEVQIAGKLRLRVTFQGGRAGSAVHDPFGLQVAQRTLLNFQQTRSWQENPPANFSLPSFQPNSVDQYKVMVSRDGFYTVTYIDLLNAGINPAVLDPQTIKLQRIVNYGSVDSLQEMPILVEGEADGSFDAQDYILFYGQAPRGTYTYYNIYTKFNIYWLSWGGADGLRVESRLVQPGSAQVLSSFISHSRTEVDSMYERFGYAPDQDWQSIDYWMWYRLDYSYPSLVSKSFLQYLPQHLVGNDYTLTVALRGYTLNIEAHEEPDHKARISWNGTQVSEVLWDGQNDTVAVINIPGSIISPTDPNDVVITALQAPGSTLNSFFLDWLKVDYWRTYHVVNDTLLFQKQAGMGQGWWQYHLTGLQDPNVALWDVSSLIKLDGYTRVQDTLKFQDNSTDNMLYYCAGQSRWMTPDSIVFDSPSSLLDITNQVDYLIITHEDFYEAAQTWDSLYSSQGLHVMRVKVGDIYDEFSFGMKNPTAIRNFIRYAYYLYSRPALSQVLLMGDASWDYKNNDDLPFVDYVPTHSIHTYKWGETACDNWFAAVSSSNVNEPQCGIGRLPVNNGNEIEILKTKSLTYTHPPQGFWQSQAIFSNGATQDLDARILDSTVQVIVDEYFPAWYDPPRVYNLPYPGNEKYYGTSQDLINYLNQGASTLNYQGHAGNQMWSTLSQQELTTLINGEKLPFVHSYSCYTGIFSNTTGFGETFILQPGGGAIAYYSNTSIGYLIPNAEMDHWVCDELFSPPDSAKPTFGAAQMLAKIAFLAQYPALGEVAQTFTLLGDPGLKFVFKMPVPEDTLDHTPPQIAVSGAPGSTFRSGDYVTNPVQFNVLISDSSSLDVTSPALRLRHVTNANGALLDSLWANWTWVESNPLPAPPFAYTLLDSEQVKITYGESAPQILPPGEWALVVSMRDYYNNLTVDSAIFKIEDDQLRLEQPLNYPNPFSDHTSFTFSLSLPADIIIKIYTVSGKLVRALKTNGQVGYNILEWDGCDQMGDPLSNGAYLYKIIARSGSQQIEHVDKLARIR
jgi:hypothetical protein